MKIRIKLLTKQKLYVLFFQFISNDIKYDQQPTALGREKKHYMIEISWSRQTNRDKWRQICTRRRTMSNFLTTKCNKTHKKYQAREAFSLMLICWKWKIFIWFFVMSFSLYLHNALWKPVFLWPAITHVLVVHSHSVCMMSFYNLLHCTQHQASAVIRVFVRDEQRIMFADVPHAFVCAQRAVWTLNGPTKKGCMKRAFLCIIRTLNMRRKWKGVEVLRTEGENNCTRVDKTSM